MTDMLRTIAAIGLLSAIGGGYPTRRIPVPYPKREYTPEELAKIEQRRELSEQRSKDRAEAKQRWQETYNPQYATEPSRDEFPSRQAFRAAHRKWQAMTHQGDLKGDGM